MTYQIFQNLNFIEDMFIFVEDLRVGKILGNTITGRFNQHIPGSSPQKPEGIWI